MTAIHIPAPATSDCLASAHPVVVLRCVTSYPSEPTGSSTRLSAMDALRQVNWKIHMKLL